MDWSRYLLTNEALIHILCNILTAFGTVGAVIVSLYFSYRSNNPKAKIKVNAKAFVRQAFNPMINKYEDTGHYAAIEVLNLGLIPVQINCFFWCVGIFKKEKFYQMPTAFDQSMSSSYHPIINYGQDANYYIDQALFLEGAKSMLSISRFKFINWFRVKFYYIIMKSNVGNCYKAKIDKSLQNEIIKAITPCPNSL